MTQGLPLLLLLLTACQTDPVTGGTYYSPLGNDYASQDKFVRQNLLTEILITREGGLLNEPEVVAACREVFDRVGCDVVLLATTAFAAEAEPQILEAVRRRRHVVSIVQELFFPVGGAVECAARIDRAAREAGIAVTAVGINPGFIMDVLPTVCSSPCWRVDSVDVRRHVDFSPYGPD
jgi:4-hydroxy-tetrahydrodipicolinate reductase